MEKTADNKVQSSSSTNSQTVPATTLNPDPSTKTEPKKVMNKFPKSKGKNTLFLVVASFLVVLAGVGTGWLLSGGASGSGGGGVKESAVSEVVESESEAGIADESQFADSVEGTLVEGGIEGEGTHHLEREGGPSQNVYLTSTVINLQNFVGKKVKVWGDTLSGKSAGWLMDVGKIKVAE